MKGDLNVRFNKDHMPQEEKLRVIETPESLMMKFSSALENN